MSPKKLITIAIGGVFLTVAGIAIFLLVLSSSLPEIISLDDYKPRLVSEVFDRSGEKIGEFYKESRKIIPFKTMPPHLSKAFIAAEDSDFFEHNGVVLTAFIRAAWANLKAGQKVQGGSTITMQVARSIILKDRSKRYIRKIKEIMLSYQMEKHLSKEDIIFLYLNEIYLGQGAHGVGVASEIYFRKPIEKITLEEAALLAGLPQAPSRYSPIRNPSSAKARQIYVLKRMAENKYITQEESKAAIQTPVKVYWRKNYKKEAPFFLETLRQMLVKDLGNDTLLEEGLKIHTSLDLEKQKAAQVHVKKGLRDLDKRQGYRGAQRNISEVDQITEFLLKTRDQLLDEKSPFKIIDAEGKVAPKPELNLTGLDSEGKALPNIPSYIKKGEIVDAIVTGINDKYNYATVRFAEARGVIALDSMSWARKPDPKVSAQWNGVRLKKISEALNKGDIIKIRVLSSDFTKTDLGKRLKNITPLPKNLDSLKLFSSVTLEQEPIAEAALISLDIKTSEVISMVGGYNFSKSEFNRSIQAARQTGSSFKAFLYASAMDHGYTPATIVTDAPIVFEEKEKNAKEGEEAKIVKWKPTNHSKKYMGDLPLRRALIRSLNNPTVELIEDLGVQWTADYARRLGIFSPLNMDFTLGLGSSGVTPYEMTKAFAHFANLGKKISPIFIHKVLNQQDEILLENISLDQRFEKELAEMDKQFEERKENFAGPKNSFKDKDSEKTKYKPAFLFNDPNQLIKPTTAYLATTMLEATISERDGTGGAARALGRPVAGKTGSTNGYFDAWFVGYTPDIATSVWVGFDEEKSLGKSEVGGRSALPIWLGFMKNAHKDLPKRAFPAPPGIVLVNIDNKTGKLASPSSDFVVRQAFVEGTEPQTTADEPTEESESDFYKEELAE